MAPQPSPPPQPHSISPLLNLARRGGRAGIPSVAAALALVIALLAPLSLRAADPVITEFMADNGNTIVLADGSSPDWIEIHNPGGTAIDLEGWHLTDTDQDLNAWTFPAGASIAAGDYLVVYASGENSVGPGGEYHTSFKLSDAGEYLALVRPDGTVLQEFSPTYPKQYGDISYGIPSGGLPYGYFQPPTPGAANNGAVLGFVKDTTFSHKRGFYDATFQLDVTTATPGATIYYTTDGSDPGPAGASVAAPDAASPPVLSLNISTTTIVRAYAAKTGFESTNTDTQTYIFLDDVIADPVMSTAITGHPTWGPQMRDALLEIPSISLVTQKAIPDLDPDPNATDPYKSPPEIPVSIEMIFPDGSDGFQANAGVERFGGQYTVFPKQALRVSFKEIYGPKRLNFDLFGDTPYGGDTAVDEFDQIVLRNGSHDSVFSYHYSHSRGAYIRSRYCFDRQIEAGHLSMRGKFVHVYLNGSYHGQYHLMERPTADFMATHLGGEEEDYDIMKGRSGIFVAQGDATAWDHLVDNTDNYALVQDYMDVDSYIDYMLLNFYGGNDHDWYPSHNWVAGRKREPGGKFKFFMWDNDFLFRRGGNSSTGSTANTIDNGGPENMLSTLDDHADFRIRMADRAQKHFFNGGMLSKERVKADFTELAESISRTIIPEAARWSAEARTFIQTDQFGSSGYNVFFTPDTFQGYIDWIVDVNAETRSDVVIGQMQAAGLFPDVDAPSFSQHGGFVGPGTPITMATDADRIYYTVDGSDPRLSGGAPDPNASVATFSGGGPTPQTFVDSGHIWKYLDDGSNQGTAWKEIGFPDGSWQSGPSQLGYGEDGEVTEVEYGPNSNTKYATTYFRTTVDIPNPGAFADFLLRLKYDDAAAVYVNGADMIRTSNLAAGAAYNIYATSWLPDESSWKDHTLPTSAFVAGVNTIAVEVHQESGTSSDIRLDMILRGGVSSGGGSNITDPLYFSAPTLLRARSYNISSGEWSALNETSFLIGIPAASDNLVISKIHYNPSVTQGDLAEYVELMNISDQPVNLAGVTFSEGITFAFDDRDTLLPGGRAVVVADSVVFATAYGAGATILGTYTSRLANGGERLTLSAPDGTPLQSLRYNDKAPWPTEADGGGYSLVLISPESAPDHEPPQNWRASVDPGGSAGASDSIPFVGDPESDLFAYALGDPAAIGLTLIEGAPALEFPRIIGADDVTVTVEVSNDLLTWSAGEAVLLDQSERIGNSIVMHWAFAADPGKRQFVKLVVSLNE